MKKRIISILVMIAMFCCIGITYFVGMKKFDNNTLQNKVTQTQHQSKDEPQDEPQDITSTLTVCGDIMSHMPQTNDAWDIKQNKYDYSPMIKDAESWISKADYAVGNLETTFAGGSEYSGYPAFNTPDELSDALKNAGFDLLLTANNHCMDKGYNGLVRTLDVLDQRQIAHVGTYRTQEERDYNNGIVVADVGGISVAFLGYTYGTNGIPVKDDKKFSVNIFNKDYMTNASELDKELLLSDISAAKNLKTDLIAVMIHWGIEYQIEQNQYQRNVAQFLLDNGVDIILGGHPHVLQPMYLCTSIHENGEQNQGFICYSLGNFISAQKDKYTDTTVILNLKLQKDGKTGKAYVKDFNYVPMLMVNRGSGAENRFQLVDAYKTLAEMNENSEIITKANNAINNCHFILGVGDDINNMAA